MMRSATIHRLGDVRRSDPVQVGGKAASLGELIAAGVRVPEGVVLGTEVADMSAEERALLLKTTVAELGDGPFAVRSSGVTEDGADRSFAGLYETVLDVTPDGLAAAVDRCLASAHARRVAAYRGEEDGRIAVIIQRMVRPAAAGVALTADPITGDRGTCIVTAVQGLAERLVSGAARGDEWVVNGKVATARRQPEHALDRRQAGLIASEARRIAVARGLPQDIEWAIDAEGTLWLLQARPMTALPPEVSWEAPAPGAYTRTVRFGEWISEPVTPLFESWLLPAMEDVLHSQLRRLLGQRFPHPYHVVVNGWYFYSINFLSGKALIPGLPSILWHLVRYPRHLAGVFPPLIRHSYPVFELGWRDEMRPRYWAAVADAEERVDALPVGELPGLVDELAELAGEYFTWIATLGGAAYKTEINLANFYRRHLAPSIGGSHLPLLSGFEPPTEPEPHAVVSLDWWWAPVPYTASAVTTDEEHSRVVEARRAAEEAAFEALTSSPRRLRKFERLLVDAQHLVPIRESQTREMTLPWPVMRRAVLRMGEQLAARELIGDPDDAFFLTRSELEAALAGDPQAGSIDTAARRSTRDEQAKLVPPMLIGRMNRVLKKMWDTYPRLVGAARSNGAIVSGTPASPGRATGPARVVRGPDEFDQLQPGEILVAPLTAPAWTPLFTRAAGVVTDVGSPASHASIIAREYGIPAVVGCGDATARLRTGIRVAVDGSTGNVEAQGES